MKSGNAWVLQWRQLIVDVATGVATVLVVAATAASADLPTSLAIACALVGIAWLLERSSETQSASHLTLQLLRPPSDREPARSGTPAQQFDAPVVDATSG
jgi:hypothetical protein